MAERSGRPLLIETTLMPTDHAEYIRYSDASDDPRGKMGVVVRCSSAFAKSFLEYKQFLLSPAAALKLADELTTKAKQAIKDNVNAPK